MQRALFSGYSKVGYIYSTQKYALLTMRQRLQQNDKCKYNSKEDDTREHLILTLWSISIFSDIFVRFWEEVQCKNRSFI